MRLRLPAAIGSRAELIASSVPSSTQLRIWRSEMPVHLDASTEVHVGFSGTPIVSRPDGKIKKSLFQILHFYRALRRIASSCFRRFTPAIVSRAILSVFFASPRQIMKLLQGITLNEIP